MAATSGIGPVKQALVRALRASQPLKDLVGSDGINEATNPRSSGYPHIIYTVVYSSREWDGTKVTMIVEFDVWSISDNPVGANNLDQLVADSLEEKVLDLSGSEQTSLLCRRIGDLSSPDLDGAGTRIFQMCGVYRIWSDQQRTA